MDKKIITLITLLFLSIGFASTNTSVYVESLSKIVFNTEDYKIYFSSVYIDEEDYTNRILNDEKTTITYTATDLKVIGATATISYEIVNASTHYDAVVSVNCTTSNSKVVIENVADNILLNSRKIKAKSTIIKVNETISEDVVITCTLETLPSERTEINEDELIKEDTYVLYGTYKDSSNNVLSNANLVIYSDTPHYVTTDENGYLFYNGLEQGVHEIYYVNNTLENIKAMTKTQVISNAVSSAQFTTSTSGNIVFTNNSYINNTGLMESLSFCRTQLGYSVKFEYTGEFQEYTSLCNGVYKIELWGAQGGYAYTTSYKGGLGAYTSGEIDLDSNQKLLVTVGRGNITGNNYFEYNYFGGGGGGYDSASNCYGGDGGGASDIRLNEGITSRIMVAAGGGGAGYQANWGYGYGSAGGGLKSENATGDDSNGIRFIGTSATQTSAGTTIYESLKTYCMGQFGYGGHACYGVPKNWGRSFTGGGGGGGYYGGGGSSDSSSGSGGSSFISGHNGCVAIKSETEAIAKTNCTDGTTDITCSYHYSGYKFNNTIMIDGDGYKWTTTKGNSVVGMPTHDGTTTMTGNSGDGYAKITLISLK